MMWRKFSNPKQAWWWWNLKTTATPAVSISYFLMMTAKTGAKDSLVPMESAGKKLFTMLDKVTFIDYIVSR